MTKVSFAVATVGRAMAIPNIAGIKDSSGDLENFASLCRLAQTRRPDWAVLIGQESLLAQAMAMGAHGGVCSGANVAPEIFVELYNAVKAGEAEHVRRAQARVEALARIYRVGSHLSAVIKGIKCALSLLGVCDDFMAELFRRFRTPGRAQVARILEEAGLFSTRRAGDRLNGVGPELRKKEGARQGAPSLCSGCAARISSPCRRRRPAEFPSSPGSPSPCTRSSAEGRRSRRRSEERCARPWSGR